MRYFKNFQTLQELKSQFWAWAKKLHPDVGGNGQEFKAMYREYEDLLNNFVEKNYSKEKADFEKNVNSEMMEVINQIIFIEDVDIEIIGFWLWVSGNTYPYREKFKELGMKFSGKKKAWYWKNYTYKKRSRKHFDLPDLRAMYGSEKISNEESKRLETNYYNH